MAVWVFLWYNCPFIVAPPLVLHKISGHGVRGCTVHKFRKYHDKISCTRSTHGGGKHGTFTRDFREVGETNEIRRASILNEIPLEVSILASESNHLEFPNLKKGTLKLMKECIL